MAEINPAHGEGHGTQEHAPGGASWQQVQKEIEQQTHQDQRQQQQQQQVAPTGETQTVAPRPRTTDWASMQSQLQQDLAIQAPEQVPQSYKDLIKQRTAAQGFTDSFWTANSMMWGQLVTSRYREKLIEQLSSQLPEMDRWVANQNRFAGVSGALTHLRVQALNISNPAVRIQALQEIDALASMSPEDQQAFIAYARGQQNTEDNAAVLNKPITGLNGENMGAGGTVVTPNDITQQSAQQVGLQAILGDQYAGIDTNGRVELHTEPGQTATLNALQQAALEDMFPELMSKKFGRVVGLNDVIRSAYESEGFQNTYDSTLGMIATGWEDKNPLEVGEGLVGIAGAPLAAAAGAGHAASAVLRGAGASKYTGGLSIHAANVSGLQARFDEGVMNAAVNVAGTPFDLANYAVTGRHLAPETKQFWGNLSLIVLLHEASEAGGAFKTAGTYTEDYASGVQGFKGGTYGDVLKENLSSPAGYMHPLQSFIDPLVQESMTRLRGTTVEEWAVKGSTEKLYNYVADQYDNLGKANAKAAVMARYPWFQQEEGVLNHWLDNLDHGGSAKTLGQSTLDYAHNLESATVENQLMDVNKDLYHATKQLEESQGPELPKVNLQAADVNTGGDIAPEQVKWVKTQDLLDATPVGEPGAVTHLRYERPGTDVPQLDEVTGENYPTSLQEHITTSGHPKPIEVSVDEAGQLKIEDGNHALTAASAAGEEYVPIRVVKTVPEGLSTFEKSRYVPQPGELPRGFETFKGPKSPEALDALMGELDSLKAIKRALEQERADILTRQGVIFRFPNKMTMPDFLHRVLYRPETLVEKLMRKVLNPEATGRFQRWSNAIFGRLPETEAQGWAAKLVDKIGSEDRLVAPHLAHNAAERAKAMDGNLTYLNRLFQRFGVSSEDRVATIGKLVDTKSAQQFWEVVTRDVFGDEGILSKYIPKNTPSAWKQDVIGRYKNATTSKVYSGIVVNDPVTGISRIEGLVPGPVENGAQLSKPSLPDEFAGSIPMPSAAELDRVLSGYQRLAQNLHEVAGSKWKKFGANLVAYPLDWNRAMFHLSTSLLKPVSLFFNLPAIIATKQLDELLGNAASPNMMTSFRATRATRALTGGIDSNITANALGGFFDDQRIPTYGEVNALDILKKGVDTPQAKMAFASIGSNINRLYTNWFTQQFVRDVYGEGGMDRFKERMVVDPRFSSHLENNLKPQLEEAGMDLNTYLDRLKLYTDQTTFNDAELIHYVKTGKMSPYGGVGREWHGEVEAGLAQDYLNKQNEASDIRFALGNLDPKTESEAIRAHQARLSEVFDQLDDLQGKLEEFGGEAEDKVATITPDRPSALAKDLAQRVDNKQIELPDKIQISQHVAPETGGGASLSEVADGVANKISGYLYGKDGKWSFRSIGRAEGAWARGNHFDVRAGEYTRGFINAGMDDKTALEFGRLRAGLENKDMFYDLTARSSVERSLRNIFWYAPVNGELLYRWLYAIPAQSGGWLPGAAITVARAEAWLSLLHRLNIVQKNADGEDVLPLPGMGRFISQVTGGRLRLGDTLDIPLKSLNPHLSSPIPALAPLAAVPVTQLAQHFGNDAPVLKDLSHLLAPHAYTTWAPNSARMLYEVITGHPMPFSDDYTQHQHERSFDISVQYAYHDLYEQGELKPELKDYKVLNTKDPEAAGAAEEQYHAALANWYHDLYAVAEDYQRGASLVSGVSSAIMPGYIEATDSSKVEYEKWFNENIQPELDLNDGQMSNEIRATWNRYLAKNPASIGYSISYNYYTGKVYHPDVAKTDEDYYNQLYLNGVKDTMPPEDYIQVVGAMSSQVLYQAKLQAKLDHLAPDGKASTMLRNWGQRSRAVANEQLKWQNYLKENPEAKVVLDQHYQNMLAEFPDAKPPTLERQYVTQTLQGLSALSKAFSGEDNLPTKEFSTVVSRLKELNSQLYVNTGGDLTPMEQGISWYFDTVLDPYFKKTKPLYAKAADLQAHGISAGPVYDQINQIKRQYDSPHNNNDGQDYPGIDEFFFDTKTHHEKNMAVTSWTTKPLSWLSPFQRRTVGYTDFKGEDKMFGQINDMYTAMWDYIDKNDISTSSTEYDNIKAWHDRQARQIADNYGAEGKFAYKLESASPYVRLQYQGYGANNTTMQNVYWMVQQSQSRLTKAGVSPTGYSEYAIALKNWVYDYIAKQEDQDPAFLRLMQKLSLSTTPLGGNTNHPMGAPLWEAIFYGNFNVQPWDLDSLHSPAGAT